jgi:hypothetical protein
MKRVNFSNGMRMAPLLGVPLGPSIARRLAFSLNNLRPRRNARYPQRPQTHLRISVPRSPQGCRVNLHVCPLISLLLVQTFYVPAVQFPRSSPSRPRASSGMISLLMLFSERTNHQ